MVTDWSQRMVDRQTAGRTSRARRETGAPGDLERVEIGRAFLDQARYLIGWYADRADALERKGAEILGFSGIVLVLFPTLLGPISAARGSDVRLALALIAGSSSVLFASGAAAAIGVLFVRTYSAPDTEELLNWWVRYAGGGTLPSGETTTSESATLAMANMLINQRADESPAVSIERDASKRATWLTWSVSFVASGVAALAALFTLLLTTQR